MTAPPLLEWNDAFRIGVAAVDHEHAELIDLINAVYAELQAGARKITIVEFLGEVYARISSHFALEEKKMRDYGYDHYLHHKRDHERLLDEIATMIDVYEDDGYFDADTLARQLGDWFGVHFRTEDARLHQKLG